MAKEYIEREAARAWLHEEDFGTPDERWRPESEFGALVDALPAADVVEVKHGEWIAVPSSDMSIGKAYKCSECGKFRYGVRLPPYCQECGAKMDGGNNG